MSAPGAIPIAREPDRPTPGRTMEPALPPTAVPAQPPSNASGTMVGIPISSGEDPVTKAILDGPRAAPAVVPGAGRRHGHGDRRRHGTRTGRRGSAASLPRPSHRPPPATGSRRGRPPRPSRKPPRPIHADPAARTPRSRGGRPPAGNERCADERRIADERCELATRARAQADAAADALRLAQRTYDAHEAAAVTASWGADPRAIHDAKDAAQGSFRAAVNAARVARRARGRGARLAR